MKRKVHHAAFVVSAFVTLVACSQARASHSSVFYDFNTPGSGLRNCTVTGGFCLSSSQNQPIIWEGLDTLPARNSVTGQIDSTSRIVMLSFDLVNPAASTVAGNLQVTAKSHYVYPFVNDPQQIISSSTVFNESVQLSLGPQSRSTTFVFNSISGMGMGLELDFSFVSFATQGAWGLDNIRIDWGQPVPEPAAFGVLLTACMFLSVARVRQGIQSRCVPVNITHI